MKNRPPTWLRHGCCALVVVGLGSLSAASEPGAGQPSAGPGASAAAPPPRPEPDGPLSLARLLALAERNSPDLAVARAQADAARGRLIQAGLYPNPMVSWEADDLNSRFNAAGMQGPMLSQQIVTADKLRLSQAAAAQGVAVADWQALTRWFEVVTRVRLAYYEALTARRDVQTNEEVVRIAQEGLDVAEKLLKAGTGTRPDVLRAQVELEQSRIRLGLAERRQQAAWQMLALAVGVPALPATSLHGSLEAPPPRYDWQPVLEGVLARSSELQEARAAVQQAEAMLRRAQVEWVPNLQLSVRPFYAFPEQKALVRVEAGAMLPLFNRNQGNIAAAQADLARAHQEVRQAELRLTERLTGAYQRYQNARLQTEVYDKQILPNAAESLRLVRLGYERGDPKYDYTAVLQAQRILVEARLAYVQALGDLWRAASEIAGLLQLDQATLDGLAP
jgi:cobalt-zinc-cadmium efflux system outer membrane protein